jgi:hypothetical protein
MADNSSGGVGVLGVLVGALIVIVVGGGLLFATGKFPGSSGSNTSSVKLELPKPSAPAK